VISISEGGEVDTFVQLAAMQQYRLIEAVGRLFDTALSGSLMIFSGIFDKYPKLRVLFVHTGGTFAPLFVDSIGSGT
jgi:predicted TIM-barrel fold metal-dependent hydrolase